MKKQQPQNSCNGGKGNGSCGNKDLFTLPFCGGKRIATRSRARRLNRFHQKVTSPKTMLLIPYGGYGEPYLPVPFFPPND